jgi:hypothetical protein
VIDGQEYEKTVERVTCSVKEKRMRKSAIGLALALAALFAMNQSRAAEQVMSDGKCWTNTSDTNFGWGNCKKGAPAKRGRVIGAPGGGPGGAGIPRGRDGGGDGGGDRGGGGGDHGGGGGDHGGGGSKM